MMGWTRWVGMLIAVGPLQGWSAAQAVPQPAAGIEAVKAYAGEWKIETEHYDTAQSKASHENRVLRNDCWKSGGYFACNQYVDGDSKVLIVFTYDAKAQVYHSYQIPPDGNDPGHGTMTIEGSVWTFPWQTADGGVTTYFRVVNVFHGTDQIEFRQEYSTDRTHWTLMAKGHEARIGKP